MIIDIFSDTVCPWCYIGKRRLEAALAARPDLDFQVTWHPFELNPEMPDEGMDCDEYFAERFGDPGRFEQIQRQIQDSGSEIGLEINFGLIDRMPNTARSHALVYWGQQAGIGSEMIEAIFDAYFSKGRDIGDPEVLADIAAGLGLDRDLVAARFEANYDLDAIRAVTHKGRELGLSGVPCFIINHKYVVVGAQASETFLNLFEKVEAGEVEEPTPPGQ